MRIVHQIPLSAEASEFGKRFGVAVHTVIDMTEMGPAIMSDAISAEAVYQFGYCGKAVDVWPHFEVRLVDEHDLVVPVGTPGELVVRCEMPWVISAGYHNNDMATSAAWRNGWFHTGDLLRQDAEGSYYFVDRKKDSLRRRGENISSAELESQIAEFDGVQTVAAVATISEHGEDEVLVVIETALAHT